jgi:hypothetical protein
MPDETEILLRRLIGGDAAASEEILDRARLSESAVLLVAAALVADDAEFLVRATANATTTRDRQLVSIAAAHLAGNVDLLDALARDHLSDHPDNVLAAWIAGRPTKEPPCRT